MAKRSRVSIFPAAAAVAALFLVLPRGGADHTIAMTGGNGAWRFTPATKTVDPEARIAFTNETRVTHTATCAVPGCAWDTGDVQPGQTIFVRIAEDDGSFLFACRYHGRDIGMTGTLTVGAGAPASSPTAVASPTP